MDLFLFNFSVISDTVDYTSSIIKIVIYIYIFDTILLLSPGFLLPSFCAFLLLI